MHHKQPKVITIIISKCTKHIPDTQKRGGHLGYRLLQYTKRKANGLLLSLSKQGFVHYHCNGEKHNSLLSLTISHNYAGVSF